MDRTVTRPYDRLVAIDGRRVFDWDDGAIDRRFALRPLAFRVAAGGPSFRETVALLELPAQSALAGTMAACSLASWALTSWERRRWPREREQLSDHADPPHWK
jgi:hypothetical protein